MKVDLVFAVRHRVPNRSAWKRGRGGRSERERERKKERRRGERKRKTETSRLFITFTGSTVAPNGSGESSLHNTGCEQTNRSFGRETSEVMAALLALFFSFSRPALLPPVSPFFRRPPPSRFPKYETCTRTPMCVRWWMNTRGGRRHQRKPGRPPNKPFVIYNCEGNIFLVTTSRRRD